MPAILEMPSILKGADNLPSPPGVAVELLRLTENEEVTIEELSEVISRDPALAAKLLKVSNSALYGLGGEVTSLNRACMLLGLKTVRLMSLSFSLATALSGKKQGRFDYDQFWRRSLICASAARALANRVERLLADEAFLAGLLSRIGQLVLAQCASSEYAKVLETSNGAWPTPELEETVIGSSGDQVGLALLESWAMPEITRAVIASIRIDDHPADPYAAQLAPVMRLAAACEELVCSPDKTAAMDRIRELGEQVELRGEALDEFLLEVEREVLEVAKIFDLKLDSLDMTSILQQAHTRMLHASLSVAAMAHQVEERGSELETIDREQRSPDHTDQLTGVANRACFDQSLEQCLERRMAGPAKGLLGLLLIGVDQFHQLNDAHGRSAADAALKGVAEAMESVCRETELAARFGDAQFSILMPSAKPLGLRALAERIREKVEQTAVEFEGQPLEVTVSLGGAYTRDVQSREVGQTLIKAADETLRRAKQAGGNRFEV